MALIAPRRERLIRSAERLVVKGRLQAAIAEYRKVLQKTPGDTNTLNRVGDLYARLDQIDEAVELFRRIAEHYTQDGFFVKAIAIYKKILRLDPAQLAVYDTLADLYSKQGLLSEARAQYRVLAESQRSRGDLEGARELHQKMLDLEPAGLGNMAIIVELQEQQGQLGPALDGYRFMSLRMLDHGDGEGADRVFFKALEVCPDEVDFVVETVGYLRRGGHGETADRWLTEALDRHPGVDRMVALVGVPATVEEPTSTGTAPPTVVEAKGTAGLDAGARRPGAEVEEPTGPVADGLLTESGDLEFELDLQNLEQQVEEPAAAVDPPAADGGYSLDLELLERSISVQTASPPATGEEDPLAEADIFLKYGLHDKAADCLSNILASDPDHVGALSRTIGLHLSQGSHAQVVSPARRLAALGAAGDDSGAWSDVSDSLLAAGFRIAGAQVDMPPAEDPDGDRRAGVEEAAPASEASDVSWLDSLKKDSQGASPVELFDSEEEFFDLAAELEDELNLDIELATEPPSEIGAAPTLDRIVESFRQKIDETLSPSDYDTHYNLGIAYREMGLLDEAISEFQLAAKDARYLVDCCSLLGACFLEKGFPDLAVKWYRRGVESSVASESERMGLNYELSLLFESIGDTESAREALAGIVAVDSGFRDVVARLDRLDRSTDG